MQIYVAMRGIVPQLNRWEDLLLNTPMLYEHMKQHPELGIPPKSLIQLMVRPIRLYEIAFPTPMVKEALNIIKPGKSWDKGYDKYLWAMRKALKLKEIPKIEYEKTGYEWFDRFHQQVDVTGIGMREDKFENGIELI